MLLTVSVRTGAAPLCTSMLPKVSAVGDSTMPGAPIPLPLERDLDVAGGTGLSLVTRRLASCEPAAVGAKTTSISSVVARLQRGRAGEAGHHPLEPFGSRDRHRRRW